MLFDLLFIFIGSSGNKLVEIEYFLLVVICLVIFKINGLEIYDFFIDLNKYIFLLNLEILE